MFLLKIIKSEAFITEFTALVGALMIALILFALYNSSWLIRKKTKAEAIQKLKLDSIIKILDGTEELKFSIFDFLIALENIAVELSIQLNGEDNLQVDEFVKRKVIEFEKNAKVHNERISRFILLIKKDLAFNEGNDVVIEQALIIKDIYTQSDDIIKQIKVSSVKYENGLAFKKIKNIIDIINNFSKKCRTMKLGNKLEDGMEIIFDIYIKRLN